MQEKRRTLLSQIGIKQSENKMTFGDWEGVSREKDLSEEFIREFKNDLEWFSVSKFQKLSESLIVELKGYVNWLGVSKYQKLSENFIRENVVNVCWEYICIHQKLSENFLREFQDRVYWGIISSQYKLTDEFLIEFKDMVNWEYYFRFQEPSFYITKKIISKSDDIRIKNIKTSHFNEIQKQEIEKLLAIKYMFIKN